jgi:hypothetical protein
MFDLAAKTLNDVAAEIRGMKQIYEVDYGYLHVAARSVLSLKTFGVSVLTVKRNDIFHRADKNGNCFLWPRELELFKHHYQSVKSRPFALLSLLLLLAGCASRPGDTPDMSIVLGERVGAIKAATTREQLVEIYGADNLSDTDYPIGEGETVPGTIIFPGTPREATVVWLPGQAGQKIDRVVITGEEWLLPDGIRHGAALPAVERINGGPFMIYGFGWDYGGVGYFKGGALDRKVQIWFRPSVEAGPAYQAVLGDSLFNSSDEAMRAVAPVVQEVAIVFGAGAGQ